MRSLQEVTRLKADAEADGDLAWLLMLDALVFQAEAEARWLDLCEVRLAGKSGGRGDRGTPLSRAVAEPPLPITERSS
jgi:hypothetical protein